MALQIDEQPAATDFWRKAATMPSPPANSAPLGAGWLRRLCFDAGADDVRFVEGERAEWASQCAELDALLPATRTLIVLDTQRQLFNNRRGSWTRASKVHGKPPTILLRSPCPIPGPQERHAD